MEVEVAHYFAFSIGTLLFGASVYKMIVDSKNLVGYLFSLAMSLIIISYGFYKVS